MTIRHVLSGRLSVLMVNRVDLNTQTKVAGRSGLGQSTIQRILACESSATIDALAAIAEAFGVSPNELLSDSPSCSAESIDTSLINDWNLLTPVSQKCVRSFMAYTLATQQK